MRSRIDRFIIENWCLAKFIGEKYGIDPIILLAQSGHETAWGKRCIANNMFGIKATPSWKGEVAEFVTHEYIRGRRVRIKARFRAYKSKLDSLEDYIRIVSTLSRYKEAWQHRHLYQVYFEKLVEGGYATDPAYAEKLKTVYEIVRERLEKMGLIKAL